MDPVWPRPGGRAIFDSHASCEKPTWAAWAGLVIDLLELDRPEFEPGEGVRDGRTGCCLRGEETDRQFRS